MEKEIICDCNIIHKDVVENMEKKMPKDNTLYRLADLFKIVSDPTRVKILWILDQSEMCVCDIANVLNRTKSSISHQLATLRDAGVVKFRKAGKTVYYSLDDDHVKDLFEIGLEHINHVK